MNMLDAEWVLSDGKFAAAARPSYLDWRVFVKAFRAKEIQDDSDMELLLLVRCVKVDGRALTADEWCEMPAVDVRPIVAFLGKNLGSVPE